MKKITYTFLGYIAFAFMSEQVCAASILLQLRTALTNDGINVVSAPQTSTLDLSDAIFWTSTTQDGYVVNDLNNSYSMIGGFRINDLKYSQDRMLSFDFTMVNNSTTYNRDYSVTLSTSLSSHPIGSFNATADITAELTGSGAQIHSGTLGSSLLVATDKGAVGSLNVISPAPIFSFKIPSGTAQKTWSTTNTLTCGIGANTCEDMNIRSSLSLSTGDQVRIIGSFNQMQPVPLPSSAWLFCSAITAIVWMRRKAKSRIVKLH